MKSKYKWQIQYSAGGLQTRVWDTPGAPEFVCENARTTSQVAKQLGKSTRHIYRTLASGTLRPIGKFLGEWLFDPEEIHRFDWTSKRCRLPLRPLRASAALQRLFPEYDVAHFNPWTNAPIFITRILEGGKRTEWRWLFHNIPRSLISVVVREHGERLMSPRTHYYWKWLLKI